MAGGWKHCAGEAFPAGGKQLLVSVEAEGMYFADIQCMKSGFVFLKVYLQDRASIQQEFILPLSAHAK